MTHAHFWLKRKEIEKQCEEWIADMEKQVESDPKGSKAVAVSLIVLKVDCHNEIDYTYNRVLFLNFNVFPSFYSNSLFAAILNKS